MLEAGEVYKSPAPTLHPCSVSGSETQAQAPQRDSDLNIYRAPMPLPFDPQLFAVNLNCRLSRGG